MKVLIKQPAGLGDVFFCQKIAAHYSKELGRCSVIWPVVPHFAYIQDYLRPTVATEFVSVDSLFQFKDAYNHSFPLVHSPLGCMAINLHGHSNATGVMKAKYEAVKLDWRDWLHYFHFERKPKKEEALWKQLGLSEDEPYVLVNRNFASPPDIQQVQTIKVPAGMRVVEMDMVPGFNVFDWCKVLEWAIEIHTVETSICYIMERLELQAQRKLFMYARNKAPDWTYIDGIYYKPWHYEGRQYEPQT